MHRVCGVLDLTILKQFVYQQGSIRAFLPCVQKDLQQMRELRFSPLNKLFAIPSHRKRAEEPHIQNIVLLLHIRFTASQKAILSSVPGQTGISNIILYVHAQKRHKTTYRNLFSIRVSDRLYFIS